VNYTFFFTLSTLGQKHPQIMSIRKSTRSMGAEMSCCSTERDMKWGEQQRASEGGSVIWLVHEPSSDAEAGKRDWHHVTACLTQADLSACCFSDQSELRMTSPGHQPSSGNTKIAYTPAQNTIRLALKMEEAAGKALDECDTLERKIEEVKAHQADLKSKKERDWRNEWQKADNLRQSLVERYIEAKSAETRRTMRPVRFDSFSKQLHRSSSKSWHQALMSGNAMVTASGH
jgi:hypothetical protein